MFTTLHYGIPALIQLISTVQATCKMFSILLEDYARYIFAIFFFKFSENVIYLPKCFSS